MKETKLEAHDKNIWRKKFNWLILAKTEPFNAAQKTSTQ
jgi:hypothetical protein